ncbi:WG repeat-containing protein [bacterium]|nr:WG repeat-containing protein [bacterium]
MRHQFGIQGNPTWVAVLLALLLNVPTAHSENPSDPYQDPAIEENWMLDRKRQLILDKPTYLNNLREQRQRLETELKKDPKLAKEDSIRAAHKLAPIYQTLGQNRELIELASRLEEHSFVASQWFLHSFYLQRGDKKHLLQVLKRSYALQNAGVTVDRNCALLAQLADLHYQLGEMSAAEKYYKEAAELALKDVASQKPPKGTYILVPIGAIYSYACFLAVRGRLEESDSYMSKAAIFAQQRKKYDLSTGYGGYDDLGTFLEIIKKKDPILYSKYYQKWLAINAETPYAGILSKNGREISAPIFRNISTFEEGQAVAQERFTYRYGYIDKTGKWKLKPIFLAANPFSNGVATVKISNGLLPIDVAGQFTRFSLIDSSGKELRKLVDLDVTPFRGSVCLGYRLSRNMAPYAIADLIDSSGETLLSGRIGDPLDVRGNRFKLFVTTGEVGHGCVVHQVGYRLALSINPDPTNPGHFKLRQENVEPVVEGKVLPERMYSYFDAIDKKGEPVNDSCKMGYEGENSFLVDLTGKKISKNYHAIQRLNANCFRVSDTTYRWGLIDARGQERVTPRYKEIRAFSEGLAAFHINDRWGFVNESGKEIVPAKYTEVGDFHEGLTFYRRK